MKEKKESSKSKKRRFGPVLLTVIAGICVLIAFFAFYVLTVVLSGQELTSCVPEQRSGTGMTKKIGSYHFTDIHLLCMALDTSVPDMPTVQKQDLYVFDDTYAGRPVWRARVEYENGAVLDVVMPSYAASLLEREGLALNSTVSCDVCNLSAVLCEGKGESCLLFTDENAAYALYMPSGSDDLMRFAAAMIMTE